MYVHSKQTTRGLAQGGGVDTRLCTHTHTHAHVLRDGTGDGDLARNLDGGPAVAAVLRARGVVDATLLHPGFTRRCRFHRTTGTLA